ncbi:cupin domain-containing protein [Clostridium sp. BNL1100]|uniref:helix-turn-helix domain-containing protein n=1 Tax=Clostridium sp. BNL1100 TaxID=755731 RepID=UPI00024A7260|nr:cupin domain-containing protein [Clostridium sp. BNL1100]AEY65491.1 putative transcriptional regulator with cupin domain [Clostridium sp. BNL1100]
MNEKVKDIAVRIKGLRLLAGSTEEEVAEQLGVKLAQYKLYENAEDDIPVSLLYELAEIYKVNITEILTGTSPKLHDICHVKKGEGLKVERYDQYSFESLAYKYSNRKIEPMLVVLDPGNSPEMVSHKGQEFNYCLEGKMQVLIGKEKFDLEPGDSLYFNSSLPHKQIALDGKEARFLTIILL